MQWWGGSSNCFDGNQSRDWQLSLKADSSLGVLTRCLHLQSSNPPRSAQLRGVALLFFQELGEHAGRIDFDERTGTGGQHFTFGIVDLGGAEVLATVDPD